MRQKLLISILVGLVAILALALASQMYLNKELSKELDLKNASELLSLQEKCNEQSKKIAFSHNYRAGPTSGNNTYQEYSSHYNTTLKKCFSTISINVDNSKGPLTYTISFIDPFENRDYGSYMWLKESAKGSLYYGENPHICKLQASRNSEKTCSSLKEFQAFVATYME